MMGISYTLVQLVRLILPNNWNSLWLEIWYDFIDRELKAIKEIPKLF